MCRGKRALSASRQGADPPDRPTKSALEDAHYGGGGGERRRDAHYLLAQSSSYPMMKRVCGSLQISR